MVNGSYYFKKCFFALLVFLLACNTSVFAQANLDLEAKSAILIDEVSGKVMYDKNAHAKMYPASTTKILTALVALEYFSPEEIITVGREINLVPIDSSKAGSVNGEHITVLNLLRGLLIKSGNEIANVIALNVAKRASKNESIQYEEAEAFFCRLMNERAAGLGAVNTHFTNPHGYHDENHYTTAYDMAIISREALKNDIIRQISAEVSFVGSGAGDNNVPLSIKHDWITHNELLLITSNYYYPYATGIKTGFTNESGYSISASAEKDNKYLIAVIMFATEFGRLNDSVKLFDYGFNNFNNEQIQSQGGKIGSVSLSNGRRSDSQELELTSPEDFICLLSEDELSVLQTEFIFDEAYVTPIKDGKISEVTLVAPIAKDTVVGTVKYVLNGNVLYTGEALAAHDAVKRDILSDVIYFFSAVGKMAFQAAAVPYWLIGISAAVIIIVITSIVRKRKAARKSFYSYNRRRRY